MEEAHLELHQEQMIDILVAAAVPEELVELLQIQVVVGEVKTQQQATAVSRVARYGYGPFFAPPRKVRPEAGIAPAAARQANVA